MHLFKKLLSENEWCDDDTDDDAAAAADDDDMTDNMIPMCLTCYAGDTKNGKDKRYRSLFHRWTCVVEVFFLFCFSYSLCLPMYWNKSIHSVRSAVFTASDTILNVKRQCSIVKFPSHKFALFGAHKFALLGYWKRWSDVIALQTGIFSRVKIRPSEPTSYRRSKHVFCQ